MKTYIERYLQLTDDAEKYIKTKMVNRIIELPIEKNVYFYGEYNFLNRKYVLGYEIENLMPSSLFEIADLLKENELI